MWHIVSFLRPIPPRTYFHVRPLISILIHLLNILEHHFNVSGSNYVFPNSYTWEGEKTFLKIIRCRPPGSNPGLRLCKQVYLLPIASQACLWYNLQNIFFPEKNISSLGGRGHWAVTYTSPQSFIMTFSYSLKLPTLGNFD